MLLWCLFLILVCLHQINSSSLPTREIDIGSSTSLTFFAIGDWGQRNANQSLVARAIGVAAGRLSCSFIVSLGDNFYENGVNTDTDPEWDDVYTEVFNNPTLNVPWFVIEGNHDHANGNGQGEIDFYLNKRDDRWILPSYWYSQSFIVKSSSSPSVLTMDWFFIDTYLMIDENSTAAAQLEWLSSSLANSTATWRFVAGHYPIYSGGEHGGTAYLLANVLPLLIQYSVDAYFCGHDHTMQHLFDKSTNNNLQFWVQGNGSKRGTYSPIAQSVFGLVDPGFSTHTLDLSSNTMFTTFIDRLGKQVYNATTANNAKK